MASCHGVFARGSEPDPGPLTLQAGICGRNPVAATLSKLLAADVHVLAQRGQRRGVLAGSQGTFQSGDRRGVRTYALGNLGLRKPGVVSSLEQGVKQFTFFAFDAFYHGANRRAAQGGA